MHDVRVHVDDERVENNQLPDVLVVLPDGQRWAFEVQYAALTGDEWQARHDGYAAQEIHDVWLLGHLPPNLQVSRRQENHGNPHIGPLHQAIHANGMPVLWINPFTETVAAALFSDWDAAHLATTPAAQFYGAVPIGVDMLDNCTLHDNRFTTPSASAHLSAMDARRAQRERRLAEEERQRLATEEEHRRRSEAIQGVRLRRREYAQLAARRTDEQSAELEKWKTRRQQQDADNWHRYKAETVKPRLGPGPLPWYLTKPLYSDRRIWSGHPNYWRSNIFVSQIASSVGHTFRFQDAARQIANAHTKSPTGAFNFVGEFLRRLRDIGSIDFAGDGDYFGRTLTITVVADHNTLPATEPTIDWAETAAEPPRPTLPRPTVPPPEPTPSPPAEPETIPAGLLPPTLSRYQGTDGRRAWQQLQIPYLNTLRRVPNVIADPQPHDGALGIHPPLWRHLVAERLLPGRVGRTAGPASAARILGFTHPAPTVVRTAITEFLDALSQAGYLTAAGGFYIVAAELQPRSAPALRPDGVS